MTARAGWWCPSRYATSFGLSPEVALEIEVVDGHLELSVPHRPTGLVTGPHGTSIGATGTPITDEDVRRTLEAVRERR